MSGSMDFLEVKLSDVRHVRDAAYWKLPVGTPIIAHPRLKDLEDAPIGSKVKASGDTWTKAAQNVWKPDFKGPNYSDTQLLRDAGENEARVELATPGATGRLRTAAGEAHVGEYRSMSERTDAAHPNFEAKPAAATPKVTHGGKTYYKVGPNKWSTRDTEHPSTFTDTEMKRLTGGDKPSGPGRRLMRDYPQSNNYPGASPAADKGGVFEGLKRHPNPDSRDAMDGMGKHLDEMRAAAKQHGGMLHESEVHDHLQNKLGRRPYWEEMVHAVHHLKTSGVRVPDTFGKKQSRPEVMKDLGGVQHKGLLDRAQERFDHKQDAKYEKQLAEWRKDHPLAKIPGQPEGGIAKLKSKLLGKKGKH